MTTVPFIIIVITALIFLNQLLDIVVVAEEQCIGGVEDDESCQLLSGTVTTSTSSSTSSSGTTKTTSPHVRPFFPPDCSVGMNRRNGVVVSLHDRRRGSPIMFGDVVIQLTDANFVTDTSMLSGVGLLEHLRPYCRPSEETGGMMEGKHVHSVIPGIGMMTTIINQKKRSSSSNRRETTKTSLKNSSLLPFRPSKDDGECARESCHAAGSFSTYHNYTWFARQNIAAGQPLFVYYDDDADDDDHHDTVKSDSSVDDNGKEHILRPVTDEDVENYLSLEWWQEHGMCLDNMMPRQSTLAGAGRGAFATRPIPQQSVLAPVPIIPIFNWTVSLKTNTRGGKKGKRPYQQWQLLLNYCYGHAQSSLVLFPYSPVVNFINHGDVPNVRLQWSQSAKPFLDMSLQELQQHLWKHDPTITKNQSTLLLLELVTLRALRPGEELFLDYGSDWRASFQTHTLLPTEQQDAPSSGMYAPAEIIEEVATKIRTQSEQIQYPYAENVETSCFYDYQNVTITVAGSSTSTSSNKGPAITTIPWNWTRHVFDWHNLRPCSILHRDDAHGWYTVHVRNRHSGVENKRKDPKLPKRHFVSKVPRQAIRFTDKLYSTNQHLPQAFRHWIGVDDVFPNTWLDQTA